MSDDDSPWMKMSDEDKSKTPEFEPISPDYSFDKPPEEKQGEPESPDGPPQEIPNLSPSPSKNSEAVQAAVVRYYKLKGDYDAKYKNAKNKITKSDLSLSEMRKKIKSMKMKCINCKQNGGTIFTNKDGILTAKCGNTESPCALDIQIKRGKWMLLTKAADLSEEDIELSKENIIDLKLDLLFGLRTEEQIASDFDESKRDYKSLVKQLDMINGVIESENTIKIGGPTKDGDSVRNIPIKEYLNIKKRQLKQLVIRFKSLVKEGHAIADDRFNKILLDLEILGLITVSWITKDERRIEVVVVEKTVDKHEAQIKETTESDYEASFPGVDK